MSLHRNHKQDEMLDLRLKNYLKNWVASIDLPPFGKERLLSAAMRQSKYMVIKKRSILSILFQLDFKDGFFLWNQNPDIVFSSTRYNRFIIDFGIDPRMSMHFS